MGRRFQAEWLRPGVKSPQKSEERMLEVEFHPDQAIEENQEIHGPEGRGNRRLASESTPVEQGQYFATSTGILDREGMSELSDISTEIVATRKSPTDNTMMAGVTEKQATSSSFSERVKITFGNIFPFATLSLKKGVCNSLVWIEIQNVFERSDCPEDFSRSSSGSPEADR